MFCTGYKDDDGNYINIGDILISEYGGEFEVVVDEDGDIYCMMNIAEEHSCREIPYALNNGYGWRKKC